MRVAGFGFRKNTSVDSMLEAFEVASGAGVTHIATLEGKACAAFSELGARLGLQCRFVSEEALEKVPVATQSLKSIEMYGTGSVSEAAALIAAGPGATLLIPRVMSEDRMATCAIAEGGQA